MKLNFLLFFLSFSLLGFGQVEFSKNDFIEFGVGYNSFINSDYFSKSSYGLVPDSDPIAINCGLEYNTHLNYQLNFRYGKAITPYTNVVIGVDYTNRKEYHYGSYIYADQDDMFIDPAHIHNINYNLGIRFDIVQTKKIEFSIGGGGQAHYIIGAPKDFVAGYYGRAILGYNLNQSFQINTKYGYQSTVGKYHFSGRPIELAVQYKML